MLEIAAIHTISEGSPREGYPSPTAGTATRAGEHGRPQQLLQLWRRRREQRLSGTPIIAQDKQWILHNIDKFASVTVPMNVQNRTNLCS